MTVTRKITAFATAAVLGMSTLAPAPARAGNDEATSILTGLIGVAILGALINGLNEDPPQPAYTTQPVNPVTRKQVTRNVTINRNYDPVRPRQLPTHMQNYLLPKRCVNDDRARLGNERFVGTQCLSKHFPRANSLPGACKVRYWNRSQTKVHESYNLKCLQRYGYRIAGQ